MNRKPQDLKLTDLPGADPQKFSEWRQVNSRAAKAPIFGLLIWATALITVPVIGGGIGWLAPIILWFIYMFAYAVPLGGRERRLAAELGIPAALGLPADYTERAERRARLTKRILIGFVSLIVVASLLLVTAIRRDESRTKTKRAVAVRALARTYPVNIEGSTQTYSAAEVKPGFFDSARVFPALGLFFHDLYQGSDSVGVVVLSYDVWKDHFKGDPAVLGSEITFNGRRFTVVGVAPPGFREPDDAAMWTQEVNSR